MRIHWWTFEDIRHTCPYEIGNWHNLPRTFHPVSVIGTTKIDVKTYITSTHERFNTLYFVLFSTFRVDNKSNKLWFWENIGSRVDSPNFSCVIWWMRYENFHLEKFQCPENCTSKRNSFSDNWMKMKYFHRKRESEKLENLFSRLWWWKGWIFDE